MVGCQDTRGSMDVMVVYGYIELSDCWYSIILSLFCMVSGPPLFAVFRFYSAVCV